jgi:hypothetical protein
MTRLALAPAALLGLGVARLLPETGAGLYLRLLFATALVLTPGILLAAALGRRSASAALAWALAALFAAATLTFVVGASLTLVLVLLVLVALAAAPFAARGELEDVPPGTLAVLVLGVLFGLALWHVAGAVAGDGLFHLARVRKLDAFGSLSLRAVDEFKDGGLHPGYAFPLWHVFLAAVSRIAGVDPSRAVLHEASVLAPLSFLVVFEAGAALFRSTWAGVAVLAAQLALNGFAAGHGGIFVALALPATAAKLLLVPALLALVFAFVHDPGPRLAASIAVAALALTLIHATYALFVLIPLGGYWLVRGALAGRDVGRIGAALAAIAVPTGAVALWLLPLAHDAKSHDPSASELERGIHHYRSYLDIGPHGHFRLSPEVFARGGAVAVAALVLVPSAALALRRRWGAFVLGGSLAILLLTLVAPFFSRFAGLVSLSQARRVAAFLPYAFAVAGGATMLARVLGTLVLPGALLAGVLMQFAFPGQFGYRLGAGGPAWAAWFALLGGAFGVAVAALRAGRPAIEPAGPLGSLAACLFVLPVFLHGLAHWSPHSHGQPLTAGLRAALNRDVPTGDVVFSDLETSYRIAAYAPVYIAAAPPAHVADTNANRPLARRRDVMRFFHKGSLAIPRRYGAQWVVVDRHRFRLKLRLPRAYADRRYVLYRLR